MDEIRLKLNGSNGKRKGFMKFNFINPLSVAFRLWAHQGMILGPPDYESGALTN